MSICYFLVYLNITKYFFPVVKYTIIFITLFASCVTNNNENTEIPKFRDTTISNLETTSSFKIEALLSSNSLKKTASWTTYNELVLLFSEQYSSVSPSDALEHSKELLDFAEVLGDSLNISLLKSRGVYARINTLESEVLRLHDMSFISSIKAEEVQRQTGKIANVISSLNAKINAVFEQDALNSDLDFDESIFNFDSIVPEEYPIRKRKQKRRSFER